MYIYIHIHGYNAIVTYINNQLIHEKANSICHEASIHAFVIMHMYHCIAV